MVYLYQKYTKGIQKQARAEMSALDLLTVVRGTFTNCTEASSRLEMDYNSCPMALYSIPSRTMMS